MPGAAFVEMALTIARDWKDSDAVALTDLEILRPLVFAPGSSREILCRISSPTSTFEIMSRPRLSASPYVLHARGGIIDKLGAAEDRFDSAELEDWREGDALYALGIEFGLEFGPAYRQLSRARRVGGVIEVRLSSHSGDARYGLDPARLDSCFHGLILLFEDLGRERIAYLPVRFGEIQLGQAQGGAGASPSAHSSRRRARNRRRLRIV